MKRKMVLAVAGILTVCVLAGTAAVGQPEAAAEQAAGSKEFSLQEAVDYALENSSLVKLSAVAVDTAEVAYKEANDAYKDGKSYYDILASAESGTVSLSDRFEAYKLKEGYYKDLAEMGVTLARKGEEQTAEIVKFSVESAYFDLLFARDKVEIQKSVLDAAGRDMDIVDKKFELGMVSEVDVLSAEASLESARLSYNTAVREAEYKAMTFNKTLGLPLKTEVVLTDELTYDQPPEEDLEERVAQALENRYEIIAAREQYEMDKRNLDLTGGFYTSTTYAYKEAQYQMDSSYYSLVSTEQDIELSVRKAYMDMMSAYDSIGVLDKNVERLEQAYHLAQLRYDVGMATSHDVVNALNALNEVKLQRLQSVHAYNLARKQFEASYGIGISPAGSSGMSGMSAGGQSGQGSGSSGM